MTENESHPFKYMSAAQEISGLVTPGNELQEAAAADIVRLAFDMEVRKAFTESTSEKSS